MTELTAPPVPVHPSRLGWTPGGRPARLTPSPTLGAALLEWAADRPDDPAYFVYSLDGSFTEVTTGELARLAGGAKAELAAAGVRPGDRVSIGLETSVALLATVFGCFLLGAAPVVVEPPLAEARARIWRDRFGHALSRARPRLFVTDQRLLPHAEPVASEAGVGCWAYRPVYGEPGKAPSNADSVALLQLTSGTLDRAKAAVLSHRAILANAAAVGRYAPYLDGDLMVSWLPLHHDMGFTGATLTTFVHRIPVVLLPPMAFLLRPHRWLQVIHQFRATLSPAPNFAYHLCAAKLSSGRVLPADLDGLDLSSWRIAFNGAEVVRARTVELWRDQLMPYGFAPEAMRPSYGMAEMGVAVSLAEPGLPRVEYVDRNALARGEVTAVSPRDPAAQALVAVGRPLPGYRIRVVGPDGVPRPEGQYGRIHVTGPSLMDGYLNDEAATGQAVADGWLDTGDLGYLHYGQLFVAGRARDMLIVGGRNLHPYAAEDSAAAVPGVRQTGVVVIGVPDPERGTETVAVVLESTLTPRHPDYATMVEEVSRAVADQLGVGPGRVVVVRPGTLPRTPSGKLRRGVVAAELLAGTGP